MLERSSGSADAAAPWLRVGAGTPGGRYLRRFFQPACRSVDLVAGRPLRSTLLGETLTLYRGESGRAHAVAERCAHRGTLLSLGRVEGEALRCHHHGWCFDASGQCVDLPGEGTEIAARVRVRAYATHEYLGLVFVYLGEGAAPPVPRFVELEGPGDLRLPPPEVWPVGYFERLQNSHDALHVAFAHRRSGVSQVFDAALPCASAEETPFGMRTKMSLAGAGGLLPPVLLYMPNTLQFQTPVEAAGGWVDQLVFRVPIDDTSCASYTLARVERGSAAPELAELNRPAAYPLKPSPTVQLGLRVLAGELAFDEARSEHLTELEDFLALAALPPPDANFDEKLVAGDAPLSLMRTLYAREIGKLERGEPLTRWSHLHENQSAELRDAHG